METVDYLTRGTGAVAGGAVVMAVPHIGCLAALTPVFAATGAGAWLTTGVTYLAGAVFAAGGLAAWRYGMNKELCCIAFGETPRIRLKKGLSMAAFAAAAGILVTTLSDRGPSIHTRAIFLEAAQRSGMSVWDTHRQQDISCGPQGRWWFSRAVQP